jgi:hypothetical protein
MAAEGILGFLQALKCHRPRSWQPVAPTNLAHVNAALRAGRGALLWVTPSTGICEQGAATNLVPALVG